MRYGCCLSMVAEGPDKTGREFIKEAARIGYDYIELPLSGLGSLSEDAFHELKKQIKDAGITCEACNNFFPADMPLVGPRRKEEEILKYTELVLGRAERLGAEYVGLGSGASRNVPQGVPLDEGYRQLAGLMRQLGRIAEKKGITILIEPLRKEECNLIHTLTEARQLAEDTGSRNVKILVDYYHFCTEKETADHITGQTTDMLRHVHFARPDNRYYPTGEEHCSYKEFFHALKSIGYDSRISFEAYANNFSRDAEAALGLIKASVG
ncbi:sugar phosphate isomerase/epimerase family protein [Lactonifactor longoviformis]|uniref:sugar phosphate isomerase/epimerase family protein n=1 Tax=Lactonifactor longoviformis TaxID=341220 RepID=UPI0036F29875